MSNDFSTASAAITAAETTIRNAHERAAGMNSVARKSLERGAVAQAIHGLTSEGWTRRKLREALIDGHGYLHCNDPELKRWMEGDEPRDLGIPLTPGQSLDDLARLAESYGGDIDAIVAAASDIGAALMQAGVIDDMEDLVFVAENSDGECVALNATDAALALADQAIDTPAA